MQQSFYGARSITRNSRKPQKPRSRILLRDIVPRYSPLMEDPEVMPTDTTWSIGKAMLQIPITEITAPDNHILQEPDNLSAIAYGDPIVTSTDTPQLFGKAPSHNSVSDTRIPDIQISSRPDNSSSLAYTITTLADSVSKLNQLLQKEREKSERLLFENFTLKTKNLEL